MDNNIGTIIAFISEDPDEPLMFGLVQNDYGAMMLVETSRGYIRVLEEDIIDKDVSMKQVRAFEKEMKSLEHLNLNPIEVYRDITFRNVYRNKDGRVESSISARRYRSRSPRISARIDTPNRERTLIGQKKRSKRNKIDIE